MNQFRLLYFKFYRILNGWARRSSGKMNFRVFSVENEIEFKMFHNRSFFLPKWSTNNIAKRKTDLENCNGNEIEISLPSEQSTSI